MKASSIAIFTAGFIAGGILLGSVVADARITSVNLSIAGVPPNSGGSLFCVTATNTVRTVTGVYRGVTVTAQDAQRGPSAGVELKCPA